MGSIVDKLGYHRYFHGYSRFPNRRVVPKNIWVGAFLKLVT